MIYSRHFRIIVALLTVVLFIFSAKATFAQAGDTLTYQNDSIDYYSTSGDTITLSVDSLAGISGCHYEFGNGHLDAILNLGEDYEFGEITWNASVTMTVIGIDHSGNEIAQFQKILSINTTRPELMFSFDFTDIVYDIKTFKIILASYTHSANIDDYIELGLSWGIDLKWDARPSENLITLSNVDTIPTGTNQLTFSWGSDCPFTDYEIQVLRLYNKDTANSTTPLDIVTDIDWNKALTIETQSPETSIKLTIAEGTGYYAWRVRPIGSLYSGGIANYLNWGQWSTSCGMVEDTSVTGPTDPYLFYYTQFNDDINWIYSRTFTEGGGNTESQVRVSEKMTFANGLQQVLEEQAHLETRDTILVTKTVYDYSGRPALKSLPVPVDMKSLGYVDSLMRLTQDTIYTAKYFDKDNNFNNPSLVFDQTNNHEPFSYYSDNNPDTQIPDANGYPFTRMLYQGGTNRVTEQSSPGNVHCLKSTNPKTTRIFYAGVSDTELERVFGNEAPAGKSVYKEITVDPNNITSIKYVDQEGKLIATCLGDRPDANPALERLDMGDSFTNSYSISENTLQGNVVFAGVPFTIFEDSALVTFNYGIYPGYVQDNCINFCAVCDYKVDILVRDFNHPDSGAVWHDSLTITPDGLCSGHNDTLSLTTYLYKGTYLMSREITILNQDPAINQTYMQEWTDSVRNRYTHLYDSVLTPIYTLIQTYGADSMYEYFDIPLVNSNDTIKLYFNLGECDSLGIPVITCPKTPCELGEDPLSCWDYFFQENPDTTGMTASNGTLSIFDYHYTPEGFDSLVNNMLDDVNIPCGAYQCTEIWNCWQTIAGSYQSYLSMSQSDTLYKLDLVREFLNCTGRCIQDYQTEPDANYYAHAYELLIYDPATNDSICKNGIDDLGAYDFTDWSPAMYDTLYYCLQAQTDQWWDDCADCFTSTENFDTTSVIHNIIRDCEKRCDDRRGGFQEDVVQMFHTDSIYVEGDEYELAYDSIWSTYIYNHIEPFSGTYSITKTEVECLVNGLVDHCISMCQNPNGTEAQQDAFINVFTAHYELAKPADTSGGGWETAYTNQVKSEPFTLNDITQYWDSIYGGTNIDTLLNIIQTEDKGLLLVGYSNSDISGNKTEANYINGNDTTRDYWTVKLNSYGVKVWDNVIKGNHTDILTCVKQTCDGGYILGGLSNSNSVADKSDPNIGNYDYWIVKTDSLGTVVTDTVFGGNGNDNLMSIVEIPGKGYLFVGNSKSDSCLYKSQDNVDYTLATSDYWVVRTDNHFNILWDKTVGSTSNDNLYSAILTHDGSFVLAGSSAGNASSTGHKTDNLIGSSGTDYWIVKLDSAGTVEWDKTIGGTGNDVATCVIETQYDFDLFISGYSESSTGSYFHEDTCYGEYDFWLVKTDRFGNCKMDRTYGTAKDEKAVTNSISLVKIIETKSGNYIIAGSAEKIGINDISSTRHDTTNAGVTHLYLSLFVDKDGRYLWDKCFTGGGNAVAYNSTFSSIIQSSDRSFLIGGTSRCLQGYEKSQNSYIDSIPLSDFWIINYGYTCAPDTICIRWIPVSDFPIPDFADTLDTISCAQVSAEAIIQLMEAKKNLLIDQKVQAMHTQYQTTCLVPDQINDSFTASYSTKLYHYTLYYYDRAGNLIKTVPPKGVITVSGRTPTHHNLITKYEYNSLGQMVKQITPDGGETNFFYNGLGQIRFSVNARQETDSTFSYTKYDNLGRVVEVGQSDSLAGNFLDSLESIIFPVTHCSQRVYTTYTTADSTVQFLDNSYQRNLYNRVSHTNTDDNVQTWYSYDPHGNVEWIIYDIPQLGKQYLAYEYNLVSGTVNKVKYNQGLRDQFYHRYTYDADNRITLIETSRDSKIWDRDASYEYYLHGPLRRTEIGEDKLQGLDYTYTLQGWLKAINLAVADSSIEPGKDGYPTGIHEKFAPDAFGIQLGYYTNDFDRTGSAINNSSEILPGSMSLYNGNIATWSYHNKTSIKSEGNIYKYDELNRILQSNFEQLNGTWGAINSSGFQTKYRYDPNGNLLGLYRKDESASVFDSLSYSYMGDTSSNRLLNVRDSLSLVSVNDIAGYNPYLYDEIGNLVKDSTNKVDTILWNVYGKVAYVTHNDPAMPDIRFTYDAGGNRIMKENIFSDTMSNVTTYYIRDAQGNIMSLYERTLETETGGYKEVFKLMEQPIYGSSRVGTLSELDSIVKVVHHVGGNAFSDTTDYIEVISENMQLSVPAKLHSIFNQINPIFITTFKLLEIGNNFLPLILDKLGKKDIDFSSGSGTLTSLKDIFAGKNSYNICTAEDRFGNLKFTAVTAQNVNSWNNVCLLYDRNEIIIPGSQNIRSDWRRKSIAMAKPDSANIWYYFTVGTNGKPYYSIIDFTGNSPIVRDSNLVLDNNANYGYKMAVYADYREGATSYLYMRRDTFDTATNIDSTLVMSFPVTASNIGSGNVVARIRTKDRDGEGDMQISPDGKYLGVAHYRRKNMFITGGGQVVLYDLVQNGSVLTYKDTVNFDNYTKCNTFDFTTGSKYMYISTISNVINLGGLGTPPDNILRFNIETGSRNNVISNYFGDIRRGKDTAMYVCMPGLTTVKKVTNPNYTTTVSDYTILTETNWTLTGAFPLQPYRIYPKMENMFARTFNKRYETQDMLGTSRLVYSDRKLSVLNSGIPGDFSLEIKSAYDPMPGGFTTPGRSIFPTNTKFGYQGSLKDREIYNSEDVYTTFFRELDTRTLRWWSNDPKTQLTPWESPYVSMGNNPIFYNDANGDTIKKKVTHATDPSGKYEWEKGLSSSAEKMLTEYMKTDEGRAFYSQYAVKGEILGGYTFLESGKYSDYNITIQDFSLDKETAQSSPIDPRIAGAFTSKINSKGRPDFYTQIMTCKTENVISLVESHSHENQLHGFSAKYEMNAFKQGGVNAYNKAKQKYNPEPWGEYDHKALNKNNLQHEGVKRYSSIKSQLIKPNPSYKSVFK